MTKMLSASRGLRPPDQGLRPWTTLGVLPPDPRYKLDESGESMELMEEMPLKEVGDAELERLVRG